MLANVRGFQMYKAPRGTQDILPREQPYWRLVEDKAAEMCRRYGYERIDTPVFEPTALFSRSVGEGTDIVEKQMYTFEDRGGDSMTLRPEGTAPVCRAYIEHGMHNLRQPVRLYYIAPIFRYERPQAGRHRQHWQFGAEAIGEADPVLDAEVIDLSWHFYASLGLGDLTLQLNSIGCRSCRSTYLEKLKDYYSAHARNLCTDCKARLSRNPLRLLDCKTPSCQEIVKAAPQIAEHLCRECSGHFDGVKGYLGQIEIPFELNPYLVRGLDYYTRTVFEVQPRELGGQSALGVGGRYDDLIDELGGRPTPAVGFGTGIERIILNLHKQGIEPVATGPVQVYVASAGEQTKKEAVKLAAELRQSGISAVTSSGDISLKSQLKQANSLGVSHTVIIGEDELRKGVVVLRTMAEGEQHEVPQAEAVSRISSDIQIVRGSA
jgi:histidyl-tRNA synthetase